MGMVGRRMGGGKMTRQCAVTGILLLHGMDIGMSISDSGGAEEGRNRWAGIALS